MFKDFKVKNNKVKKGFAVLFAVLLASFLITLGISIFGISLKEIQLISSSRDSQIAYYAADSARECALYWDIKKGAFPTCLSSDCSIQTAKTDIINPIRCNNKDINFTYSISGATTTINFTSSFYASSTDTLSLMPVADINMVKAYYGGNVVTTIQALGHNTGIIGRRVERGIKTINNPAQ